MFPKKKKKKNWKRQVQVWQRLALISPGKFEGSSHLPSALPLLPSRGRLCKVPHSDPPGPPDTVSSTAAQENEFLCQRLPQTADTCPTRPAPTPTHASKGFPRSSKAAIRL
ncbi:Hypothetical protein NTJ_06112 [Nesidiocoris tenuis]|uniref:Uncharacterized protein n=1 Tax=Nesidiocoris tenuis TaxID=355587 RepID=A0ABN7AMM4_9HEMI|nr:Hypothetical protein NTJ_06112 [Nesidiocoris tenuis]